MKTLLVTAAFAFVTLSSSAALQYEFVQKNTTTDSVNPVTEMTGRAIVDGERSRVDFVGGTLYPPGTYVVSTDGARRLLFVDPAKEWFTEVNTASLATALASSGIRITNVKTILESKDDRPILAGLPTEHTRLILTYDIAVVIKSIPLKQHVRTEIDTWSTPHYAAAAVTALASNLRTGNPEIDAVLDVEVMKVKGFPLRQTVTTRTVADLPPTKSKLEVPTARTIVREMWVTSIREIKAAPSTFVIPATYRRADQPEVPKAATQTLTFEPSTK